VQRITDNEVTTDDGLAMELEARGEETLLAGDGALRYETELGALDRVELAGPGAALRVPRRSWSWPRPATSARSSTSRLTSIPCTFAAATRRSNGTGRKGRVATAKFREPEPLTVHIVAMRRRLPALGPEHREPGLPAAVDHVAVPERARVLRGTRAYFVAKVGRDVVGYAGLMVTGGRGHVTTIAVDPAWHATRSARGCSSR